MEQAIWQLLSPEEILTESFVRVSQVVQAGAATIPMAQVQNVLPTEELQPCFHPTSPWLLLSVSHLLGQQKGPGPLHRGMGGGRRRGRSMHLCTGTLREKRSG
ncbi:unnamed protein product [Natator depressus]